MISTMGRRVFGLMAVLSSLAGASLETIVKSYFELQSQGACAAWVDLFAADFAVMDPHGTAAITDIGVLREACESSNVIVKGFSIVSRKSGSIHPKGLTT